MTTFPRDIKPRTSTVPVLPGPFFSKSDAGIVQTRSRQKIGWTWEESFILKWGNAVGATNTQRFYALVMDYFRNGTQLDVVHQDFSLLGAGGGTPTVNGADQTGRSIITAGWPASTTVLRPGDLVTFASLDRVHMILANANTSGAGGVTITINPPIFAGGSPIDTAAITITDSVVFKAKIAAVDWPEHGPDYWVAPRIAWTEDP